MDKTLRMAAAGLLLLITMSPAQAGPISSACLQSDRQSASRQLCNCLQSVANGALSKTDQRRAAKFFDDPHLAQETRQSDKRRDEKFWKRYTAYGDRVSTSCRGLS